MKCFLDVTHYNFSDDEVRIKHFLKRTGKGGPKCHPTVLLRPFQVKEDVGHDLELSDWQMRIDSRVLFHPLVGFVRANGVKFVVLEACFVHYLLVT